MKIIFLCGSLEPGRDGVGDYTRRLAIEVIKQGYQAAAIALNEKFITSEVEGVQQLDFTALPLLRLPSQWNTERRLIRAKEWIDSFNPEWLSLQYVPFSFNSKGLPLGFCSKLPNLGKKRKWHVMFHELWVGMEENAPKKHVVWGWLQKQIILLLIKKLNPALIHTQTTLYQKQLSISKIRSKYLPLFSNIPVKTYDFIKQNDTLHFVVFGTIHAESKIEQFAKEVASFSKIKEVKIILTLIGRSGDEINYWIKTWKSEGLEIEVFGEQSPEFISEVLSKSAMGVSTNPIELIEKSGTAMAMLEHGLPVISIAKSWKPRGLTKGIAPKGIFEYKKGCLQMCLEERALSPGCNKVYEVSNLFLNNLRVLS